MIKRDFTCVSIRGMVAYCVMCLEGYALEAYPDRDLSLLSSRSRGTSWG